MTKQPSASRLRGVSIVATSPSNRFPWLLLSDSLSHSYFSVLALQRMIIPHGLVSLVPGVLSELFPSSSDGFHSALSKRGEDIPRGEWIAFAVLIPVLVILSGVFAGLTLGYMSLDETQLNVLSVSGTP